LVEYAYSERGPEEKDWCDDGVSDACVHLFQ
jgi:hypothetical protein